MRRFLFASTAAFGLLLGAASAQVPDPSPPVPPVTPPAVTPVPATPEAPSPAIEGQINPGADAAIDAATPPAETRGAMSGSANVRAPATAAAPRATMGATQSGSVQTAVPAMPGANTATMAVPATAAAVCQPRTTSVHFGRGSALSQQNRNAIEYAVDAASVCDLQQITIVDSADGRTSSRRADAVRATLLRQGVPAHLIRVSSDASADAEAAGTGRLDVRMSFAGVAEAGDVPAGPPAPAMAPPTQPEPDSEEAMDPPGT